MRLMLVTTLFCFGLAGSLSAQAPQMNNVQPNEGKIGSVLQIHGMFLDKTKVDEVYLTDHTFDMKVKVLGQSEDIIEFRIPPSVKPARLQLLVKTTAHEPVLLEQPVFITVEEPKETLEATAATPNT